MTFQSFFFIIFDCERLVEVVFLKALYWTVVHKEISRCTNSISLFNTTVIVWLHGWSEALVLVGGRIGKIVEKRIINKTSSGRKYSSISTSCVSSRLISNRIKTIRNSSSIITSVLERKVIIALGLKMSKDRHKVALKLFWFYYFTVGRDWDSQRGKPFP